VTRALVIAALTWLGLQIAITLIVGLKPGFGQNIVVLGLTHALVLGGATYLATQRQERMALVGGFRFSQLGYGALLGLCLKLPADGIRTLVEYWHPTAPEQLRQQLEFLRHDTWLQSLLLFVVIGGSGPLVEEIFYRGLIFRTLRKVSSRTSTLWVSSLLFVTAHPSLQDWPSLLLVGLVLGSLRAADGNLWSAVGAHATFNCATVLAVVAGVQGTEAEPNFPVVAAAASAALAAALLTLRARHT
jgi:membrane protease YdiL (CAAX protease family)